MTGEKEQKRKKRTGQGEKKEREWDGHREG